MATSKLWSAETLDSSLASGAGKLLSLQRSAEISENLYGSLDAIFYNLEVNCKECNFIREKIIDLANSLGPLYEYKNQAANVKLKTTRIVIASASKFIKRCSWGIQK